MTKQVTNHMLRQKLSEVNTHARIGTPSISGTLALAPQTDTITADAKVNIRELEITKMKDKTMIATDGTQGELFYPMPAMTYECKGVIGANGIFTLDKPLKGLFITTSDDKTYCLGVNGDTDEFEVKIKCGDNVIQVNKNFININYNTFVENGVERT